MQNYHSFIQRPHDALLL